MAYLLNVVYVLLLVLAAPWVAFQAAFRGKYREGFAAKFWAQFRCGDPARPASGFTPSAWAK